MSSNKIPIYTTGNNGVPSVKFIPNNNTKYFSTYTGKKLNAHPTFNTKTDDSSGKNKTFHGGIAISPNKVMCHRTTMSSLNSNSNSKSFSFSGGGGISYSVGECSNINIY
jgi:hypothetical protein